MMPIESKVALSRRTALQLGLGGLGAGMLPGFAAAQAVWPTKAVTLVVGYPPGGQTDFAGAFSLPACRPAWARAW